MFMDQEQEQHSDQQILLLRLPISSYCQLRHVSISESMSGFGDLLYECMRQSGRGATTIRTSARSVFEHTGVDTGAGSRASGAAAARHSNAATNCGDRSSVRPHRFPDRPVNRLTAKPDCARTKLKHQKPNSPESPYLEECATARGAIWSFAGAWSLTLRVSATRMGRS